MIDCPEVDERPKVRAVVLTQDSERSLPVAEVASTPPAITEPPMTINSRHVPSPPPNAIPTVMGGAVLGFAGLGLLVTALGASHREALEIAGAVLGGLTSLGLLKHYKLL